MRVKDEEIARMVEANESLVEKTRRMDDMAIDAEILKS